MAKHTDTASQVAQLTSRQKETILRVGLVSNIIGGVAIAVVLLWLGMVAYLIIDMLPGAGLNIAKLGISVVIVGAVALACVLGTVVVVKKKFPYYSGAVYKYLKKREAQCA